MSSFRRNFLIVFTKLAGSRWTPIQTPLTNTLVLGVDECAFSSNFSKPHSSKNSMTGADRDPTDIQAMRARFLTRPQACPSGVSAGQTIPQWVLCSCRGFAIFPSRPKGVLQRRRCDKVDANV